MSPVTTKIHELSRPGNHTPRATNNCMRNVDIMMGQRSGWEDNDIATATHKMLHIPTFWSPSSVGWKCHCGKYLLTNHEGYQWPMAAEWTQDVSLWLL